MKYFPRILRVCLLLLSCSLALFSMEKKYNPQDLIRFTNTIQKHQKVLSDSEEQNAVADGFLAGTLVHTPTGMMPIQDIRVGQELLCYDLVAKVYSKSLVVRRLHQEQKRGIRFTLGDEDIETSQAQQFLDNNQQWQRVMDLQLGDSLLTDQKSPSINRIGRRRKDQTFYALSLYPHHNFAVGNQKLVAHNIAILALLPPLSYAVTLARGAVSLYAARQASQVTEKELLAIIEIYQKQGVPEALKNTKIRDLCPDKEIENLPKKLQDFLFSLYHTYGAEGLVGNCSLREIATVQTSGFSLASPLLPAGYWSDPLTDEEKALGMPTRGGGFYGFLPTPIENAAEITQQHAQMDVRTIAGKGGDAALSGAKVGALTGAIQLTVNLATGNVESVGDAVATVATPLVKSAVSGAVHAAGKQGALTLSAQLAPALTAKALPYLPGIGLAYDCYNITTGVVELGNGLLSMAKGKKLKGPSAIPQAKGKNLGNDNGGGGSNGPSGKGPVGPDVVVAGAKVLNDTKEEVKFFYNQAGEIVGQTISRSGEIISQMGQVGGEVASQLRRVTADQIRHFAEWRKQYSHLLRHVVDDCYEVLGQIPGLPDCVKFISQDRLHKGEIEVFASRTKHMGAWVADKAFTVLKWVKRAQDGRKAFGK